jgi:hypothetical protein
MSVVDIVIEVVWAASLIVLSSASEGSKQETLATSGQQRFHGPHVELVPAGPLDRVNNNHTSTISEVEPRRIRIAVATLLRGSDRNNGVVTGHTTHLNIHHDVSGVNRLIGQFNYNLREPRVPGYRANIFNSCW